MPTHLDRPGDYDAHEDPEERDAQKLMVPLSIFLAIALFLMGLYRVIVG